MPVIAQADMHQQIPRSDKRFSANCIDIHIQPHHERPPFEDIYQAFQDSITRLNANYLYTSHKKKKSSKEKTTIKRVCNVMFCSVPAIFPSHPILKRIHKKPVHHPQPNPNPLLTLKAKWYPSLKYQSGPAPIHMLPIQWASYHPSPSPWSPKPNSILFSHEKKNKALKILPV